MSKESRTEYMRGWRARNREKYRAYHKTYDAKRAAKAPAESIPEADRRALGGFSYGERSVGEWELDGEQRIARKYQENRFLNPEDLSGFHVE